MNTHIMEVCGLLLVFANQSAGPKYFEITFPHYTHSHMYVLSFLVIFNFFSLYGNILLEVGNDE